MVEMFGIYAVLLAGWGLWRQRRVSRVPEPIAPPEVEPVIKRGTAARRHLNTGA